MKADTLIKELQVRKTAAARQIAGSSASLIAPDIRRAMIKRAAKLTLAKMAGRSRRDKLAAVAAVIAIGLGQKKIAGDFGTLKAELQSCKLIGEFERARSQKTAGVLSQRLLRLLGVKGLRGLLPMGGAAAAGGLAGAAGGLAAGTPMMPPQIQYQTVPNGPDWSNSVESAMNSIKQELHRRQALTAMQLSGGADPMSKLQTLNSLMGAMKESSDPNDKTAGLGSMIGRGLGRMMRYGGVAGAGGLVGAGLMGQQQISNFGSSVGGRLTNAYNSLFNPAAVMNQQQMANIGIGGRPPKINAQPPAQGASQNPFDMDFNTMTMADFAKHRAMLQQRMMSMDQAYPGFAPQQPVFQVQPSPAQPKMTYNPNGNIPRYYGLG